MNALLLGASGLTGELLLQLLLENEHYKKVIVITRKPLSYTDAKLHTIINDLTQPENISIQEPIHVIFSCLGTTRKKTPNLEQYRHIEVEIPKRIAQKCIHLGLQQIHLISALGVKPNSSNFYIAIKHEAEQAILQFSSIKKFIYRPSLILGNRKEKRRMEEIGILMYKLFSPIFSIKALKKFKAVSALQIAKTMLDFSLNPNTSNENIIENIEIVKR